MRKRERTVGLRVSVSGFTLIELMIVVAVIAILAAIAYPSYNGFVLKTRRGASASCVLQGAQFMERFYTTKLTYAGSGKTTWDCPDASPHYSLAITVPTGGRSYTVKATANGGQASDSCGGWIQVDEKGAKTSDTCNAQW